MDLTIQVSSQFFKSFSWMNINSFWGRGCVTLGFFGTIKKNTDLSKSTMTFLFPFHSSYHHHLFYSHFYRTILHSNLIVCFIIYTIN
ncbi:hypothetical protein BCR42DRAFT_404601 [Absidia repens]|uniref:Uncharacterized protein n=1 Tax=Absidia repens TaxID=90262 RepID=A0A1X2IWD0_9FUNG|nr:hypothetical protein BCR42DRAFT_404601 [Absidia repens]